MSHSLSSLLLLYAQQFEDQHAPQNMTIALREAAKEIERLRAALKEIASIGPASDAFANLELTREIARAALKEDRT
jgi:hypothetical protein